MATLEILAPATSKNMQTQIRKLLFILSTCILLFSCTPQLEPQTISELPAIVEEIPVPAEESQPTIAITDCTHPDKLCVGFLVEKELIEVNPFYQSAKQAVVRTEEDLLADITYVELDLSTDDVLSVIDSLAGKNYDIVVTAGPNLLVETLSASQKYPDINFIGVDQDQFLNYENIIGITFEEQEAAFLAGTLAAMLTKSKKVGVVLGEVPPTVYRYLEGFEAGAFSVNPELEVVSAFYPGDEKDVYADSDWGRETAKSMLEDGVDIIFATGGQTAIGALNEVAESSQAFCIGADLDETNAQRESQSCLVSIIKRDIESTLFESIAWSSVNKFPDENIKGDYQYTSFYSFENSFTADIQDYFEMLEDGVSTGSIPIDGSYVASNTPVITVKR